METEQELGLKGENELVRWVESRLMQAGNGYQHGLFQAQEETDLCPGQSPHKEQKVSSGCGACTDIVRSPTDTGHYWKGTGLSGEAV